MINQIREKYIEYLEKAFASLKKADHIIYMTYPLLKEKNLLLLGFEEIYRALISLINSLLQYEYLYKRITLYRDASDNFEIFKTNIARRFNISKEEIREIIYILKIYKKHKQSGMEFMRNGKITIMTDNFQNETLDLNKIKGFLVNIKGLFKKAESKIKQRI